jgi:photosystem II stability/assembly factor-like uncharacterized protein
LELFFIKLLLANKKGATMKTAFFVLVSLMVFSVAAATAADLYVITLDIGSAGNLGRLADFPGRVWGQTGHKIYLAGGAREIDWLSVNGFDFFLHEYDGENFELFLWYDVDESRVQQGAEIIDRGDGYLLVTEPPIEAIEYRRLNLRDMSVFTAGAEGSLPSLLLEYDPVIDTLISRVDQEGIYDFLSRLSGALPIEINGGLDTIHTRYSGTEDNELAAQFLKETLEGYGYEAEYHAFYGGSVRHMAAYDENTAWFVTENSEALRTTDGGQSWASMPDNTDYSLWGIDNAGPDSVWIAGDNGTIRFSSDGGESFVSQSSGVYNFLFGLDFISSEEGWIAGDNGRILHTDDAGQNWDSQTTPTGSRLYDVCFVDAEYGWACGRDGTVIHSTDGGDSWTPQNSNSGQRLYGIEFIDHDNGWLVGWSGTVRRTTDGGDNWETVDLGTYTEKYHVDFPDQMHGCIVGWDGEIFVTDDGGDSWEQRSSGTEKDFYGLVFADDLTGFAGGNGVLRKTTDGGQTWISQTENIETAWKNVIGTKTGTVDPDQQVIICGHMDSRSEQPYDYAPGADDNGSGTTATMEAARVFADFNFEKTVKFCLWTGEEQGLLGSAAYAEEAFARGDDIVGVYNFDMIAWDGNGDGSVELHCGTEDPSIELGNALSDVITDYSIDLAPDILTWNSTGASDHASFWDYGYAAILGIEDYSNDFNPYYHTTGDNIDHIMLDLFNEFTKAAVGATAILAVPDTALTYVEDSGLLPDGFRLQGNYPNPFNASTTVSFAVDSQTDVDLAVYDIVGRRVETLYSGPVNAGTHRITWNADKASSGVYFYRLTAGGHEAVGRMTLLK